MQPVSYRLCESVVSSAHLKFDIISHFHREDKTVLGLQVVQQDCNINLELRINAMVSLDHLTSNLKRNNSDSKKSRDVADHVW